MTPLLTNITSKPDAPSADILPKIQLSKATSSYLDNYIFVRSNKGYERVNFADILYIRAAGAYSDIISTKKSLLISASLKSVVDQLNCGFIKRCHRSYAVNTHKVTFFNDVSLEIATAKKDVQLPISMGYRSEVMKNLPRMKST